MPFYVLRKVFAMLISHRSDTFPVKDVFLNVVSLLEIIFKIILRFKWIKQVYVIDARLEHGRISDSKALRI